MKEISKQFKMTRNRRIVFVVTLLTVFTWCANGQYTTTTDGLDYNVTSIVDLDVDREEQARRNVTQLLDNVLHGYNKNVRPNAGIRPTTVKVDIFALSLGPVIDLDMEFYIEVFFRQRWSDPRLNYNNTNGMDFTVLSLNTIMLESIWYPDTYILNGKKIEISFNYDAQSPFSHFSERGYFVHTEINNSCSLPDAVPEIPYGHTVLPD